MTAITMEVARRVHYEHGLTIAEIDETRILPCPLQTNKGVWGAILIDAQRYGFTSFDTALTQCPGTSDSIEWVGSSRNRVPPLIDLPAPLADDVPGRLRSYLSQFCPSLNCVQAICPTHCMWTFQRFCHDNVYPFD